MTKLEQKILLGGMLLFTFITLISFIKPNNKNKDIINKQQSKIHKTYTVIYAESKENKPDDKCDNKKDKQKKVDKKEEKVNKKIKECKNKIKNISHKEGTKKWFIEYKKITSKYEEYVKDESIYDVFTDNEIKTLHKFVEAEATTGGFKEKCNVASVIINRLYHEEFPDDIISVLTQKTGNVCQFSCYADGRIHKVEITEDTILACEYAFMIEDTTNGALYFDNVKGSSWAKRNKTHLFTDGINHSFYK